MRRNLRTTLKRRMAAPMAGYDRLPPELRLWLASAALPWSAKSALRLWTRCLKENRCPAQAIARLQAAEARMLARDAAAIWGTHYPAPDALPLPGGQNALGAPFGSPWGEPAAPQRSG